MYQFAILDPRSSPAAVEANARVFALGPVFGIEVTVPALAARCMANIDPQHTRGDTSRAAIEEMMDCYHPHLEYSKGRSCCGGSWDTYSCERCDGADCPPITPAVLVTVRPDLDSVGAMAVYSLRAKGESLGVLRGQRIRMIAEADRFARGSYPGSSPLPSRNNPWPDGGSAESCRMLAALAAAVADFKVPIEKRVALMEEWLLTGKEPEEYRGQVEQERSDLILALERGVITVSTKQQVAVVETTHRAATLVGYCLQPVVVAFNPKFSFQGGPAHAKFTVCQYEIGHCDLQAALAELQTLEAGWGGSPTMIGSPQGEGSKLSIDQVVGVVARHLKS